MIRKCFQPSVLPFVCPHTLFSFHTEANNGLDDSVGSQGCARTSPSISCKVLIRLRTTLHTARLCDFLQNSYTELSRKIYYMFY